MEHKRTLGRIPLFFLFLIGATASTQAQEEASGITEAVAGVMSLTEESDVSFLMERLSEIEERPAAFNSGDEEEIARLFFLTEFQVKVLADYVIRKGDIVSLYELALLPAFDRVTVMLMAPYITLEPSDRKNGLPSGRTTIVMTAHDPGKLTADSVKNSRGPVPALISTAIFTKRLPLKAVMFSGLMVSG